MARNSYYGSSDTRRRNFYLSLIGGGFCIFLKTPYFFRSRVSNFLVGSMLTFAVLDYPNDRSF